MFHEGQSSKRRSTMNGSENPGRTRGAGGRPPISVFLAAITALSWAAAVSPGWAQGELSEAFLRIEINATDGDVGFHGKFDGDPSREMKIKDPTGKTIFDVKVSKSLRSQGLTENFFESAEPSCVEQPLAAFLARFPPGPYSFKGKTIEGEKLVGEALLSHALPAAPTVSASVNPVVIQWAPGTNLGNCHDASLIPGTIPDPATVPVDSWEVTVEPDEDQLETLGLPLRVFTVQLPSNQLSVTVPSEYLQQYITVGITTFKFEVGAKAGENQTFTESSFSLSP
jgi:hypothetical protein